MKHHIKTHHWLHNILQTFEIECESLKHAMRELKNLMENHKLHEIHACKIHDEYGRVVWSYHYMYDQNISY